MRNRLLIIFAIFGWLSVGPYFVWLRWGEQPAVTFPGGLVFEVPEKKLHRGDLVPVHVQKRCNSTNETATYHLSRHLENEKGEPVSDVQSSDADVEPGCSSPTVRRVLIPMSQPFGRVRIKGRISQEGVFRNFNDNYITEWFEVVP